ncbi:MAG: hypothetical protein VX278_16465, partial [Myxococcota bacterium]|nr:hypothetical protein [Myxococcota bacterium]
MLWFLVSLVWSHPFDVEFFGHDLQIDLRREDLEIEYILEVPFAVLRGDLERYTKIDQDGTAKEKGRRFLSKAYAEIADEMRLQIDGVDTPWRQTERLYPKLETEGQFALFRMRFQVEIPPGAHQISILNLNRMEGSSIFRTGLWVSGDLVVDESDLSHHLRWKKEERYRELRLSYRTYPKILGAILGKWHQHVWGENRFSWSQLQEPLTRRRRWLERKISLAEFFVGASF